MKTVYVGLSGGVDSSVAAALLQQQGYRVVGVYMKNWTADIGGMECPWQQDLTDARAAAAVLQIPFKVFDFQAEYRQRVVDVMVAEYAAGRTPNPDVLCNQEIKFKLFWRAAMVDGADLMATGHYARTSEGRLFAGVDPAKDQSYFLYRVTPEALRQTLLPIGDYTKPQIRQLAASFGLPTANKPDSQGICFVGEVGIKPFLAEMISPTSGPVIRARDGVEVGRHDGAAYVTIGQRHGLGIGGGQPYYVVDKDMDSNTIYVTDDPADLALTTSSCRLKGIHWIRQPEPTDDLAVRLRYRADLIPARLVGQELQLDKSERAVAPGQSAVVYCGDEVLGGGIIASRPAVIA